jgi:hypothetical protein
MFSVAVQSGSATITTLPVCLLGIVLIPKATQSAAAVVKYVIGIAYRRPHTKGNKMTRKNKWQLAKTYQSAWFAYAGQAITVTVDDDGFFHVNHEETNDLLPEWLSKMTATELLTSLYTLTLNLALKRETEGA